MPTFGRIEPFEGEGEEWPSYVERLEAFFSANDVDDTKKKDIFFSCCGAKTYSLLRDLVKPAKPQDKSLDEVLDVLGSHYCPKPSVVVQRFRFNSRVRAEGETVSKFVAALKSLSEHCNFGTELGNMLRDRIVCGINSVTIQTRLLEQPDLTFEDAVQTALAMEAAKKDAGEICQASSSTNAFTTHRVTTPAGDVTCYRCGDGHLASSCKHVNTTCNYCRKRGHLSKVCNSKQKDAPSSKNKPAKHRSSGPGRKSRLPHTLPMNVLDDNTEDSGVTSSEVFDMWQVDSSVPSPPFTVTVNVCGKPLCMEMDTGATVSVM